MNKRIRELSAIAQHLSTDEATHLSRVHNRTLSLDEEQELFTEKFALLIVRECLEQIATSSECFAADQVRIKNMATNCIKKHFGVEL